MADDAPASTEGETLADKLAYWRETRRAPGRIQPGSLRYTPARLHGDHGPVTGHHLEHWNDRVDATVERAVTFVYPQARRQPPGGTDE